MARQEHVVGFGIAAFARDQVTGALRQLPGRSGCVNNELRGYARGRGFDLLGSVTVGPEGRNVYVAALDGPGGQTGIAAFVRDQAGGALGQLPGRAGCLGQGGREGCARGRALKDATSVAASPDGRNLYVAALELDSSDEAGGAVAVFARALE